jgi:hypothetical protein
VSVSKAVLVTLSTALVTPTVLVTLQLQPEPDFQQWPWRDCWVGNEQEEARA